MDPSIENYQLKWHSYNTHLHSSVAAALSTEVFTDVVLVTVDGRKIAAHRFVLSACSHYFNEVLKFHNRMTSTLPVVVILPPEIDYKAMKILIAYMYSGETTVSKDVLESVLRGGDILRVRGLWRPREDNSQKKLVKVHQKNDGVKVVNSAVNNEERSREGEKSQENYSKAASEESGEFLVIKEEPLEWNEVGGGEMELVDESQVFQTTEMTIKPEIYIDGAEKRPEELYSELTCELCSQTFSLPGEWVRHIQSHTDMLPAKRQRRGRSCDVDDGFFPPLQCDLCQQYFPTPAEWVHHVQNTHTETELRQSNKKHPSGGQSAATSPSTSSPAKTSRPIGQLHKVCAVCSKKFPSHASMIIHARTHTGEKPFMCDFCCKGFNVKSNLLRHLRTLHDKIVCSGDVEVKDIGTGSSTGDEQS